VVPVPPHQGTRPCAAVLGTIACTVPGALRQRIERLRAEHATIAGVHRCNLTGASCRGSTTVSRSSPDVPATGAQMSMVPHADRYLSAPPRNTPRVDPTANSGTLQEEGVAPGLIRQVGSRTLDRAGRVAAESMSKAAGRDRKSLSVTAHRSSGPRDRSATRRQRTPAVHPSRASSSTQQLAVPEDPDDAVRRHLRYRTDVDSSTVLGEKLTLFCRWAWALPAMMTTVRHALRQRSTRYQKRRRTSGAWDTRRRRRRPRSVRSESAECRTDVPHRNRGSGRCSIDVKASGDALTTVRSPAIWASICVHPYLKRSRRIGPARRPALAPHGLALPSDRPSARWREQRSVGGVVLVTPFGSKAVVRKVLGSSSFHAV
jgi:hypothetical protein